MSSARRFLFLGSILFASWASAQTYQGVELVQASLVPGVTAVAPGHSFTVGLRLKMAPHWHTYWKFSGDSGLPTKIEWELPPGFRAGPIQWPIPKRLTEEGDLVTYAYEDEVVLLVEIRPPPELILDEVTINAKVHWLVCEKLCIPGAAELTLTLPVSSDSFTANGSVLDPYSGQLPEESALPFAVAWTEVEGGVKLAVSGLQPGQTADFFPSPPADLVIGHPKVDGSEITIPITSGTAERVPGLLLVEEGMRRLAWQVGNEAPRPPAPATSESLIHFLLLGALGGLILNLMPCVLPVIALKLLGFMKQARKSRRKIWRLGLAFVAGVFAWFLMLAALVSGFKAAGQELNWAFQFQHPGFLIAMIAVTLLFALNLLGGFEIVLPARFNHRLDEMAGREGYGGAFWHGVFATLMATPCTAPFLGPALGFAFAQSTAVIFAMFAAIAFGMSLPYLLLSAQPGWMRFLPKPGKWMVRLKQLMGVLLLGTALWLGWVLWQGNREREPFAPQFAAAMKGDQMLFVDFTADWCVNCKVNERLVLNTEAVQKAFRENNVRVLQADWTKGDPEITKLLRSFDRVGVPLYVIYPAHKRQKPIVLPEVITTGLVREAIERAK